MSDNQEEINEKMQDRIRNMFHKAVFVPGGCIHVTGLVPENEPPPTDPYWQGNRYTGAVLRKDEQPNVFLFKNRTDALAWQDNTASKMMAEEVTGFSGRLDGIDKRLTDELHKLKRHIVYKAVWAAAILWPMPSAIVVPEAGELDARALEGFLKAAEDYGIPRTTDAKTFLQEQRAAMYVWAQIVEDRHLEFPD